MKNYLNSSFNKDSKKEKSLRLTDTDDFCELSPTPQNIDMFKRFLINENRSYLSSNRVSSIQDTEIMPQYTDIERQITKKFNDMRSFFDIKNTIFKAMQSENSYTYSLFCKGFRSLFFGPKGIVTKKSPDLRRYYKSFEIKSELNAKIYAGSLDYYDYLCNVKNSFDERLNISNKKRLEIGGNFSISNSNIEKLHAQYIEFEKKRKIQKLLNKNNIRNNSISSIDFNKFNKKIKLNILNNFNVKKTKLKKGIHNLFLNNKETKIKKNDNEKEKKRKISLVSNTNANIYINSKKLTQTPKKETNCDNSSNQLTSIKCYSFKNNNELFNSDIRKNYPNKIKYHHSFVGSEINNSKDTIDKSKKICITSENFYKNSKKLLTNFSNNEDIKNDNISLKTIKYPHTEIKPCKEEYCINKTPQCSPKILLKLGPKKLEFYETTENTTCKNTEKKEINEIKNKYKAMPFNIEDNDFKDRPQKKKNNYSLQKIKLALSKKNNDSIFPRKFSKILYKSKRQIKLKAQDKKRVAKEKNRNEDSKLLFEKMVKSNNNKDRKKDLLSDNIFNKKKINNSINRHQKVYFHYNPKVRNEETVRELIKNIETNKRADKSKENIKIIREKFKKNINTITYLRHSLSIIKRKNNIK